MFESSNLHGGTDALGVPAHDFSTNSNACGPCPAAWQAVRDADASHYPDPHYNELRARLAQHHGVASERIVLAGSASEFIARVSLWLRLQSEQSNTVAPWVHWPDLAYGDYARAAHAAGLSRTTQASDACLIWACEPSSPLGQAQPDLLAHIAGLQTHQLCVLDLAYEPLRLSGRSEVCAHPLRHRVWQMWTPNKALGMTGVRAAYVIAPEDAQATVAALQQLAPSWILGAHGVALLQAWCDDEVQQWVAHSRDTLRDWKARQIALCERLGWQVQPSDANYFAARLPQNLCGSHAQGLHASQVQVLRAHGVKLRDAASFGLPAWVRVGVLAPASQDALMQAWQAMLTQTPTNGGHA